MHPDKEYQIGSTAVRKRNSIKGEGETIALSSQMPCLTSYDFLSYLGTL